MRVYKLNQAVISCEEAAKARNVPLKNELKTLILATSTGFVAVHLPGDGVLALRAVKNSLETKEACLADPEDLAKIGITAGTVSAVLDPVWSMPHLITKRVLTLDFVTTNNGTKTAYFNFDPIILLKSSKYLMGEYENK